MSKRSIQRNITRNQKRSLRARKSGNPNISRPEIQRMTYRTLFWKTADGKKRSKTELVPNEPTVTPMEASRETLSEATR